MSLDVSRYVRKPFSVEAVQVTRANIVEVAVWCNGELMHPQGQSQYIKVNVFRPMKDRQTMAYVGDWVLYAGSGYKVYTHKAFVDCFEKPTGEARDALTQAEKVQPGEETTRYLTETHIHEVVIGDPNGLGEIVSVTEAERAVDTADQEGPNYDALEAEQGLRPSGE
jgi:hypothetical protein